MSKLTPKQEKFANVYVETGNASEAYRQAYSTKKMKLESIHRKAVELIQNVKVSARVKTLQDELKKKSDITKEEAVSELANVVRGRITDVFEFKGGLMKVKDLSTLPDEIVSCISSIKETASGIEIKLYDKRQAIDTLSRMLGWDEAIKQKIEADFNINPIARDSAKKFIDELNNE